MQERKAHQGMSLVERPVTSIANSRPTAKQENAFWAMLLQPMEKGVFVWAGLLRFLGESKKPDFQSFWEKESL